MNTATKAIIPSKTINFMLKGPKFPIYNYKYPKYYKVPSGYYISTVRYITETIDQKGKTAIIVYYDIEPYYDVIKRLQGVSPPYKASNIYRIKQKYKKGYDQYYDFTDSMANALNLPFGSDVNPKDAIGVTERITLTYFKGRDIGSYTTRNPMDLEKFAKYLPHK